MADHDADRLFDHIDTQMTRGDRRSLFGLKEFVAQTGAFSYLEIGSHLGGSLQPFVVDDRCTSIISIDPRPQSQPDKRLPDGEHHQYEGNSTERMLALLRAIPGADVTKIRTVEAGTGDIDPSSISEKPTLCFVDGEHTDRAALCDALFCAAVSPDSIVAFHDRGVVGCAIGKFMRTAGGYGHALPDDIFVVDLGGRARLDSLASRPDVWRLANALRLAGEVAAFTSRKRLAVRRLRMALP